MSFCHALAFNFQYYTKTCVMKENYEIRDINKKDIPIYCHVIPLFHILIVWLILILFCCTCVCWIISDSAIFDEVTMMKLGMLCFSLFICVLCLFPSISHSRSANSCEGYRCLKKLEKEELNSLDDVRKIFLLVSLERFYDTKLFANESPM